MTSPHFIQHAVTLCPAPQAAERIDCESLKLANYERVEAFLRSQGLVPDSGLVQLKNAALRELDAAKGQTLLAL